MNDAFENAQQKSIGELGTEAIWFVGHTLIAIFTLLVVVGVIALAHPNPDSSGPKLLGTLLAFLVPMIVGFIIAKQTGNHVGGYVWISGLLIFSVLCVWVIDLPTGNGLCEHCTLLERIWRTLFSIQHGSGLMGGDGLLVGTWIPLSLFGYALGSKAGIDA